MGHGRMRGFIRPAANSAEVRSFYESKTRTVLFLIAGYEPL
jgi:hypothetical protein